MVITSALRETAIELHDAVADSTPYDTGRAISSWNISENEPNGDTTPPLAAVRHGRTGALISGATEGSSPLTKSQALIVAKNTQQSISENPNLIFIANGLDYIEGLNDGNSKQAPAGFVEAIFSQDNVERAMTAGLGKAGA